MFLLVMFNISSIIFIFASSLILTFCIMAQIDNLLDEKIFESLSKIADSLFDLSFKIRYENDVLKSELNHRMSLGLMSDEDAIKHFNDWMVKNGLPLLCVK